MATKKLMSGDWSEKNAIAYCGANGVKHAGYEELINRTKNLKVLQHFASGDASDSKIADGDYVIKYSILNKDKYTQWCGGPFWNCNLELNQFVDALMHLVFLDVTKSTKKLLANWISGSRRAKKFNVIKKDLFTPITAMGLEWCKVLAMESG